MHIPWIQTVHFVTKKTVEVTMDTHVSTPILQQAIDPLEKYIVSDTQPQTTNIFEWLKIYWPLAMVFVVIVLLTVLDHVLFSHSWWWESSMMRFMGRWFVVFASLKLINLPWFVDGFKNYDIVASRWSVYAWVYPFIELILWVYFILGFRVLGSSIVTLLIMVVWTIWVVKALWKKFQCACIGSFFKLPLTKVTVVENIIMALMAIVMILRSFM